MEKSDNDEDEPEIQQVTMHDAKMLIAGLQWYFMQEGNENSPIQELEIYSDFVELQREEKAFH